MPAHLSPELAVTTLRLACHCAALTTSPDASAVQVRAGARDSAAAVARRRDGADAEGEDGQHRGLL